MVKEMQKNILIWFIFTFSAFFGMTAKIKRFEHKLIWILKAVFSGRKRREKNLKRSLKNVAGIFCWFLKIVADFSMDAKISFTNIWWKHSSQKFIFYFNMPKL